jgi:hypothetical protein
MTIGTVENYRTKNVDFLHFLRLFSGIFAVLTTFWRISAKKTSFWRSCCAAGVPAYASTVVAGLSSAVDSVMSL